MKKLSALMIVLLLTLSAFASCSETGADVSVDYSIPIINPPSNQSQVSEEESIFVVPDIGVSATASVGSSGDILIHNGVRASALQADGTHDFTYGFKYLKPFVTALDYAVVNAEFSVSTNNAYASLPFKVPAEVVSALADCGYDLGITANNHIQDGGIGGIKKTINTLIENGMDYTGSRLDAKDQRYLIKDINGIKIGFLNYSYGAYWNTNSFSESNLPAFYTEAEELINAMRAEGAELVYLYIHWGREYSLTPHESQTEIAAKMCDLGVDVIIGGHPHKIQPVELLTSAVTGKKTICLYSMGNLYSGQQIECMAGGTQANSPYCFQDPWHYPGCDYPDIADRRDDEHRLEHGPTCNDNGHTEDGVVFTTNVCRYEDGTVAISSVDVLPVWCMGRDFVRAGYPTNSYFREYYTIPLDKGTDWAKAYGLTEAEAKEAQYSYDRTMNLLSEGINEVNQYLAEQYNNLNNKFKEQYEQGVIK